MRSARATRTTEALAHVSLARAARRAVHELDLAQLDLNMAQERRKVAQAQLEKAKLGALGIDCRERPAAVEAGS